MNIEDKINELYNSIKLIEDDYLSMSSNKLFVDIKNFYKAFFEQNYELEKIKPVLSKKFRLIKDYRLSINDYLSIYIVETNLIYEALPKKRFYRNKVSIEGILIEYKDMEIKIDRDFKSISIKTSNNKSLFSIDFINGVIIRKEFNKKTKESISRIDYNLKRKRFLFIDLKTKSFFNLLVKDKEGVNIGIGFAECQIKNFYDNQIIKYYLINLMTKTKTKIDPDIRYQEVGDIKRNRFFIFITTISDLLGIPRNELKTMKVLDFKDLIKEDSSLEDLISLIEMKYKI